MKVLDHNILYYALSWLGPGKVQLGCTYRTTCCSRGDPTHAPDQWIGERAIYFLHLVP